MWKNLGYNLVFYLASLQNMPKHIDEAARIDGAGGIRRFWSITLPYLSPITFFLIFTNLTYALFEAFAIVDILTRGGPMGPAPFDKAGLTTTLVYKVFQDGFGGSSNMGFAAAQSVLLLILRDSSPSCSSAQAAARFTTERMDDQTAEYLVHTCDPDFHLLLHDGTHSLCLHQSHPISRGRDVRKPGSGGECLTNIKAAGRTTSSGAT